MTNATKANIIAALNALLGLLVAFGVDVTEAQTAAILVFANAIGIIAVSLTFKSSPKRIPE